MNFRVTAISPAFLGRRPSCTYGWSMPSVPIFLHGRRFAAVQIERHVLRPFRLHFRDAVDGTQRGDIVIRQSCGGQHLDVVQALGVEEPISAAERIAAACVNAGKHGHAKQGDHGD